MKFFMVSVLVELHGDEQSPRTWGTYWDKFGETLVRLLEIKEGSRVLDIGTGGGSTLFPAAKRVGPKGKVTGVEICEHCVGSGGRRCLITHGSMNRGTMR